MITDNLSYGVVDVDEQPRHTSSQDKAAAAATEYVLMENKKQPISTPTGNKSVNGTLHQKLLLHNYAGNEDKGRAGYENTHCSTTVDEEEVETEQNAEIYAGKIDPYRPIVPENTGVDDKAQTDFTEVDSMAEAIAEVDTINTQTDIVMECAEVAGGIDPYSTEYIEVEDVEYENQTGLYSNVKTEQTDPYYTVITENAEGESEYSNVTIKQADPGNAKVEREYYNVKTELGVPNPKTDPYYTVIAENAEVDTETQTDPYYTVIAENAVVQPAVPEVVYCYSKELVNTKVAPCYANVGNAHKKKPATKKKPTRKKVQDATMGVRDITATACDIGGESQDQGAPNE